jgi:hypothetical protein
MKRNAVRMEKLMVLAKFINDLSIIPQITSLIHKAQDRIQ